MIVIDQLSKTFGDFVAVNQLSFQVNPGDVVGFLGPNGAGKIHHHENDHRIFAGHQWQCHCVWSPILKMSRC